LQVLSDENKEPTKIALDKSKKRLEKLEKASSNYTYDVTEMSFKDYQNQVDVIKNKVVVAWNQNRKVAALTEVLSTVTMLEDGSQVEFYPSVFCLVTSLLDWFGDLVFDRLKESAYDKKVFPKGLPADFTMKDISDEIREITKNWFFKISSISDLLPRLYMEMALLKSYQFIAPVSSYPAIFARLAGACRGVGDPLLANYLRAYLVIMITKVNGPNAPTDPAITQCLDDFMVSFKELNGRGCDRFKPREMSSSNYLNFLSPAVFWFMNFSARSRSREVFKRTLGAYKKYCNHSMVLLHILETFSADLYSDNVLQMVELVKESDGDLPKVDLFAAMGGMLVIHPPPQDQRLPVLNEVWKHVKIEKDIKHYTKCSAVYIELLLKHYSEREVTILLKDLIKHVKEVEIEAKNEIMPVLEKIVTLVITNTNDFGVIVTSEHFLALMDLFRGTKQLDVCKNMISTFTAKQEGSTSDPVLIHALFDFARSLHDSLDSLSYDDDVKQIGNLICGFIDKIDFGNDLEQQLNVYVDCRAAFANLDAVITRLVICVYNLSMRAHRMVKGKHTKKTSAFTKACLAYCFVTIPSISDMVKQLYLNLLCGQACLINEALSQADDYYKQAISLIPEIPTYVEIDHKKVHTEVMMLSFIQAFCSSLVVMPGHPEHGAFYLVRGLMNVIAKYQWQEYTGLKIQAALAVIPVLCCYYQRKLPYHIAGIASNDDLYGGNPEYMDELAGYISNLMDDILSQLSELMEDSNTPKGLGGFLALDFASTILFNFELTAPSTALCSKLMKLALKHAPDFKQADKIYMNNTLKAIQTRVRASNDRGRTQHEAMLEALSRTLPDKV
jgi:hypothetical protein